MKGYADFKGHKPSHILQMKNKVDIVSYTFGIMTIRRPDQSGDIIVSGAHRFTSLVDL